MTRFIPLGIILGILVACSTVQGGGGVDKLGTFTEDLQCLTGKNR